MSKVITYSEKETDLKTLAVKKGKLGKKRYYIPQETDELVVLFKEQLNLINDKALVDTHNIKFQVNYIYPAISKTVWAHIFKVTPYMKMFTDLDYVVEVSGDIWEMIDDEMKKILLEHELDHVCITEKDDGTPVLKTLKHDVQDFRSIIRKYGIDWTVKKDLISEQYKEILHERKQQEKIDSKKA